MDKTSIIDPFGIDFKDKLVLDTPPTNTDTTTSSKKLKPMEYYNKYSKSGTGDV